MRHVLLRAWAALAAWIGLAYVFARRQFERMLRMDDSGEQKAARASHKVAAASGWLEAFYRLPGRFFSDPVGAIVEKELRFLSRAPRFRLLFLLAFALGQLIWLPQMLRVKGADPSTSWLSNNYLTFTCLYAMLVLAENLFLNNFGFDRAAAQNWFVLPTPFHLVLRAKNIVACFFLTVCFWLMVLVGLFLPRWRAYRSWTRRSPASTTSASAHATLSARATSAPARGTTRCQAGSMTVTRSRFSASL